ncbi:FAD/NAD(P)-binding protein [Streptomyces sp. DW26H14]|uniref:FAD/NAD(P)-binding protein n=1 Tax=Streptomyces sp. DW26H14 TaxID=3435395 RepID=UPI00403D7AC5
MTPAAPPAVVVLVGAGPRATGLLERVAANAPELWPVGRPLEFHLVDPHPPGAGRVWRREQAPLLRMNSMAEDVTVFTDESSVLQGPVRPGPSLAAWAAATGPGREPYAPHVPAGDPDVRAELASLAPTDFPTRRAQSAYLDWALRHTLDALPPHITVHTHRTTATAVHGPADGTQFVHLAGEAAPLAADLVILTQGHLGSAPDPAHRELAAFAARHGRTYVPPAFSADAADDLDAIAPGEHVVLRGLGLAFVDLVVLLTEGRGGRYREEDDGTLTYLPSGREPVVHAGSRRGVPYHSKTGYRLVGPRPDLPRYFGPEQARRLLGPGEPLDLRRDLWPMMAKEIGYGHYHELFHGHPERTAMSWPQFRAAYDRLHWYAPAMAELVRAAVPEPADRLDFEALDHPLEGRVFAGTEAFQDHMRAYVTADGARRADPAHSADLGAFLALLSVYGQLPQYLPAGAAEPGSSGGLSHASVREHLDGWWQGFFSFLASGPPGFRLRELHALSRAGVVRFAGAGLRVEADERTGTFRASSPSVPGHTVTATALVEAYLPSPSLSRSEDRLLRDLYAAGAAIEESGRLAVTPDGRVLDPSLGGPHPRRLALGHHTTGRSVAAFARPRTNAPSFRQNDAVVRSFLRTLAAGPGTGARPAPNRPTAVPARAPEGPAPEPPAVERRTDPSAVGRRPDPAPPHHDPVHPYQHVPR